MGTTHRALADRILRRTEGHEGLVRTALPGLWFFRATAPFGPKRVEARMVTLALILQGEKQVDFGGHRLRYRPGEYLFVTGERRYLSTVPDASAARPYLSAGVDLPPELVAEGLMALADAGVDPADGAAPVRAAAGAVDGAAALPEAFVAATTPSLLDAMGRLVATLDDPVARAVIAPLVHRELVLHLLRGPGGAMLRAAAARDDGRIRRAIAYMEARVGERFTVEDVARHVAMSPSHFAHRFREIARMSPMRYARRLRLTRARVLLLGDGLDAASAGASVGYASPSHFTRDFRNEYGVPPAAYRARFRAG